MCGIAGIYHFKHQEPDVAYISWCLKTMRHRGPDSSGIWSNKKNYLAGFVRLSIRDLSENGNQPMLSDCGNFCISFNGEIYNTDRLRILLNPYRSDYKSSTDTELLLYALIHLGVEKTLEECNGIFAFAFYDVANNKLILARDRMGIKPLYIGYSNDGFVYSSQYDHIINHTFCSSESINHDAIELYACLGYVPEGMGISKQTQLIPHGHYVTVKEGGWQIKSYYSYPVLKSSSPFELEDVMAQSVQQQLVSDVPLGTFMSGGVDSTLVTSFASKQHQVKTFTVGLKGSHLDESDDADAFAKYFNTSHLNRLVTEVDLLNYIGKNTKAYSEPFADYSSIPSLILSEFARKQVTVALSGDGGDELFWGYPRNSKVPYHSSLINGSKSALYFTFLKQRILNKRKTVGTRHLQADNIIDYYYQSLFIAGASVSAKKIIKNFSSPVPFFLREAYNCKVDFADETQVMNIIRKMEVDLHLQRILLKVDRAGMYNSLEIRVPLLDNLMLDYSASIDYKACIIDNIGKANLKQLLADKTDKRLVYKQKKGFDIPMMEWINGVLHKDVKEKIMDMPASLSDHFEKKEVSNLLKNHKSGKADNSWLLWAVYTLILWQQEHCKSYDKSSRNKLLSSLPIIES